ncbi:MAG: LysM peptidoglycan-binding domain-containing protein [Lachnospiraceae bacterium]|nr:LysM peptidoglycan-binding domain-containing protein [Lachnospiraceae bacterium]
MNDTPKNVRQVGDVDVAHKIYVEDYVITYTKGIGEELHKKSDSGGRAAVLLGRKNITDKDVETYINGMAVIEKFELSGESVFSNDMWSSIYDVIKTYYEDEDIVGWLYIGENIDASKDERLIKVHSGNFNGKNLIFMFYDTNEKEELFFDFMNHSFLKRKGFYIYYQKNDTMHNYMVAMNGENGNEKECDDRVVKDVRSILSKRQEKYEAKKMMKSVYAASMLVAAVALLVGTTVIYNYNTEQAELPVAEYNTKTGSETAPTYDMIGPFSKEDSQTQTNDTEQSVNPEQTDIPALALEPGQTQVPFTELKPGQSNFAALNPQQTEAPSVAPGTEQPDAPSDKLNAEQNTASEQTAAPESSEKPKKEDKKTPDSKPVSMDKTYTFYIVKPGDTLGSIAENIYHSIYYIDKIKELNSLEDENTIYSGQKLWLPDR